MLAVDLIQHHKAQAKLAPSGCAPSAVAMLHGQVKQVLPELPGKIIVGEVGVELRACPAQRVLHLTATAKSFHVIVPIAGAVVVVVPDESRRIKPGSGLLLADRERADCTWLPGSMGLILHIPRAAVQAQNFAAGGDPRRVATGILEFGCGDPNRGFGAGLVALAAMVSFRFSDREASGAEAGTALIAGLAEELERSPDRDKIFPIVGSVKRAIDCLQENPGTTSMQDLARASGVTLATLRRNIHDHTGSSLTKLLQDSRLDWANGRLQSDEESRSISQLANVLGYTSTAVFIRSYKCRFEETPTQTRARAFARR